MNKATRNFLIFAGLGFAGYFIYKRMGAANVAKAGAAARQGAIAAQNFIQATGQPVDAAISEYGLQGVGSGPVVSEQ